MKHALHHQLLNTLRSNLDHFHHSPDVGDAADVEAIKSFRALRIREAESAIKWSSEVQIGGHVNVDL
jgi:hypothetical protein